MKQVAKLLFFCVSALTIYGAEPYQKPPKAVLDVLNALPIPTLSLSPTRTHALQATPVRYPPIAELAEPMLRLAGLRIDPKTNGLHTATFNSALAIRKIPEGTETKVVLPSNPKVSGGRFSPDGTHFAFTNTTANGIELWVGETATGQTRRIEGARINAVTGGGRGGGGEVWLPDGKALLVQLVKPNRGAPPPAPAAEPHIQETLGGSGPMRTLEDMLQSPHDEDLFEYYATSQPAIVDLASGKAVPIGKPGIISSARVSPDGKYFLVTVIHRPFSYLYSAGSFPRTVEVWDRAGNVVRTVANLPLEDKIPMNGVATGPRSVSWRPSEPATLVWAEALDGGDLRNKADYRDRLLMLKAPFNGEPREFFKTQQRFQGLQMGEKGGFALVSDFERQKRWNRRFQIDMDNPAQPPKLIWARNDQDRYNDPGTIVTKPMPNGENAILLDGDNVYLTGAGSTPEGDRPFLDRFNLTTLKAERLFRSDADHYESVTALLDDKASRFLTRRESPVEPPNYFLRTPGATMTAVTKFTDNQPSIRGIQKQLVKYKRADGVDLSFTLYLPPDYKPGTRLPTLVWAYPYEYTDSDTAGQVSGSAKRFTEMTGYSQLFFVLEGYAVLDNAAMPVVGSPDTVNNTYVDQIVMDAKAAIDKAVEMGVTDRARVGVGGHSYGAFMTANLLAHCDLFKAGIAESGAYNRTLTPFGFQSETRTFWQAQDVYLKMSPFMYADKIKTPLLLIHGEADDNSGTFPIQSDRMYQAVRGNGGTVRLAFLPFEAHGYRARETIEHVLWEKFAWFDKYVKNAK